MAEAARCRANGDRAGRLRRGGRGGRGLGSSPQGRDPPLWDLFSALFVGGQGRGAATLANPRSRFDPDLSRGRRSPGALPRARDRGGRLPLRETPSETQPDVRGPGGLARQAHQSFGGRRADAAARGAGQIASSKHESDPSHGLSARMRYRTRRPVGPIWMGSSIRLATTGWESIVKGAVVGRRGARPSCGPPPATARGRLSDSRQESSWFSVPSWCAQLVCPVGVPSWCAQLVCPVGVPNWCCRS